MRTLTYTQRGQLLKDTTTYGGQDYEVSYRYDLRGRTFFFNVAATFGGE